MSSHPLATSEDVIESLVEAMSRPQAPESERAMLREALRGLVRLAQAEQLLRMQEGFNCATDPLGFGRCPARAAAGPAGAGRGD